MPPAGRAGRGGAGCPSGRAVEADARSPAAGRCGAAAGGAAEAATAGAGAAAWKPGPADPVTAGAGAGAAGCGGVTSAGTGAAAAGRAGAGVAGRAVAAAGFGPPAPGRAAPPLAGAGEVWVADPLVGGPVFAAAGAAAGKAVRSLRTTGASMVEDGDLTNSPMSVSFAMISLLVLPSSFASSCTRALPATALLRDEGGGRS